MSNTCFPFRFISRPSGRSSQSHAISCSSLMSHHRVKNKSKRVKNSIENGSFMCFVIFYYIIICYVFSEASTPVLESFMNFTGKHLFWRVFFSLKWWNYIRTFVLHEEALLQPIFASDTLKSQTSQKYNRSIVILQRTHLCTLISCLPFFAKDLKNFLFWQKGALALLEFLGVIE